VVKVYHAIAKHIVLFLDPCFPATIPDAMRTLSIWIMTAAGVFCFEQVRRHFQWSDWFTLGFLSVGILFVALYTKGHILIKKEKEEISANLREKHDQLCARIQEIEKKEFWEYANQYEASFNAKELEPDSLFLLVLTESYLKSKLGDSSVQMFTDQMNFKFTPTEIRTGMKTVDEKFTYRQWAVELLKYRANQLMKIIENKGENGSKKIQNSG
jgi:hypothetical protein